MPEAGFLITSEQIIYLCGFVAAVWGVYKIIKELRKPSDDLRDKVEKHDGSWITIISVYIKSRNQTS